MILIAGGTGNLGTQVVRRLGQRGLPLRVLTRHPARAEHLRAAGVDVVAGDVGLREDVERAVAGTRTVVSAIHGFTAPGAGPYQVDWLGNRQLIQAAQSAGVEHFILVSVEGAAPDHPMDLFRMKYRAEQELRASQLAWTIIRPTAFMELWGGLIGAPLIATGRTRIFGRGDNPINFVSVHDVARFVELAVVDPAMRGVQVDVGGPQNLSLKQVAQIFETATGTLGKQSHVPLGMMRLLALALRPLNPALARQIQAGVVMDTRPMAFDAVDLQRRYPAISLTSLAEVVQRDYIDAGTAGEYLHSASG
jgi:uncharacterized protein YbjT (DUF2867 family)